MEIDLYSLLRIYTDEMAMLGDRPVFEIIIEKAKQHHLLGVTVLRGRVGFGHKNLVHANRFLDHNYPLVVEIVDKEDLLKDLATEIRSLRGIGMITIERVELLLGGRPQSD